MKLSVDIALTPAQLAEAFTDLDDESQAQFFVEVARIIATWDVVPRTMAVYMLAKHIASCACSSDGAREFVRELASELPR